MLYDVFISYSSEDRYITDTVCVTLESQKLRCCIAYRGDVIEDFYETNVVSNIKNCKVLILVLSIDSNTSTEVRREVEFAVSNGMPVIAIKVTDVPTTQTIEYLLSSQPWVDVITPQSEGNFTQLVEVVKSTIENLRSKGQVYNELGNRHTPCNANNSSPNDCSNSIVDLDGLGGPELPNNIPSNSTVDKLGTTTTYTYDRRGKLTSVSPVNEMQVDSETLLAALSELGFVECPAAPEHRTTIISHFPNDCAIDWRNRRTVRASHSGLNESESIGTSMKQKLIEQIDQCRRETSLILQSFPAECIEEVDSHLKRGDISRIDEAVRAKENLLSLRLENCFGTLASSELLPIPLSKHIPIQSDTGHVAGALVGSFAVPVIGAFLGGAVGGLFGWILGRPNTKELRHRILNSVTERTKDLAGQLSEVLDQLAIDRLKELQEAEVSTGRSRSESVEVSVFSEVRLQRSSQALVQVFVHANTDRDAASIEAAQRDESSTCRGRHTLAVDMAVGTVVALHLTSNGLEIDHPLQTITWNGKLECVSYGVKVSNDSPLGKVVCTLSASVRDIPVGYVRFTVTIGEDCRDNKSQLVGDSAHRYERAFISYASKDRGEVLKRIPMLRIQHIEFFQDLLSLDPGDEWEERIYEEIESCDLFLLFWSSAALASEWVKREWMHAIKCRGEGKDGTPDIYPVLIEGPPVPSPPEELKRFHFRDFLTYIAQFDEKSTELS